jgi:hypothetical protein
VYGDESLASERIGDLVELDAQLRIQISGDFAALVRLLSTASTSAGDLSALLRSVNRLRLAFFGRHDDVAATGRILCSMLLADLLELRAFQ